MAPTRSRPVRARAAFLACAAALLLAPLGCETEKSYAEERAKARAAPRPDPVLVVRHHVGGTHHRVHVRGLIWYATFANNLLTIDSKSGTVIHSLELMPFGTCGGATELVVADDSLMYVLLDGTAICAVSTDNPREPRVVSRRRAAEIGFAPRSIAMANGELFVSGDGGVIAWSDVPAPIPPSMSEKDRAKELERRAAAGPPPVALASLARGAGGGQGAIGPVVATAQGLAAPVGRRVHLLADGSYIGAATRLDPLPPDVAASLGVPGGFTFILQSASGAQVGLMGPDVREIAAHPVRGEVRRVRVLRDSLVAITDEEFAVFRIDTSGGGPALVAPHYVKVKGARDVGAIDGNYFAVVGSFGRAIWRRLEDDRGPGDEFVNARREPSRLVVASTDRRRILAGGPEGTWLYTIGDEVERVDRQVSGTDGRKPTVSGAWGRAALSADATAVEITPIGGDAGSLTWRPIHGGTIHGVETSDGRLWIWHDSGVDALTVANGAIQADAAFRIEGPVRYLFPQRLGGAMAYVSEYGGFGVLDFVAREALPSVTGERIVDRTGDGDPDVWLTDEERIGASGAYETAAMDTQSDEEKRESIKPRE